MLDGRMGGGSASSFLIAFESLKKPQPAIAPARGRPRALQTSVQACQDAAYALPPTRLRASFHPSCCRLSAEVLFQERPCAGARTAGRCVSLSGGGQFALRFLSRCDSCFRRRSAILFDVGTPARRTAVNQLDQPRFGRPAELQQTLALEVQARPRAPRTVSSIAARCSRSRLAAAALRGWRMTRPVGNENPWMASITFALATITGGPPLR